ncbi:lysosomal alpha-mannosidase-like [Haemaphysalis longicornis]
MTVTGPRGHQIESQVVQQAPHRHGIPESSGNATWSLVFQAEVAPLGASLYRVNGGPASARLLSDFLELEEPVNFIENERYRLELNPDTGLVSNIVLHEGKVSVPLRQTFAAYLNDRPVFGASGPYVFGGSSEPQGMGEQVTHRVIKGHLVQEIHQIFNDYASQVITLYNDSPFIEFTWTVGPLNMLSARDSDFISVYETNLESEGFYTDNNGWKDVHRTLTFHKKTLPIPSNYYPVTSWIYIKDKEKDLQLVVLPDRPQGGSSRRKGQLELMLHRWHADDDGLGNSEGIMEVGVDSQGLVVRGTHRLFLGSWSQAQELLRPTSLQLVYRPLLVFAPARWKPKSEMFSGLRSPLPKTVHILTLERLSDAQVLLRLEHLALTNTSVRVDITRLLSGYRLEDVRPVTLAANQFLPGPTRHSWNKENADKPASEVPIASPEMISLPHGGGTVVNLAPNEIATFVASLISE